MWANSVTDCENLGFRIKLGAKTKASVHIMLILLNLHLATGSIVEVCRSVLTGWLLVGISHLSSGAHSLPQLELLTYLRLGHKLDQGFYFPSYQEEAKGG